MGGRSHVYKGKSSKLAFLMDSLGISGKDLAKLLHVDYTLVSKWRNNSRRLTPRSAHLEKLAGYFLALPGEQSQSLIRQTLAESYGQLENTSAAALQPQLMRWLSDPQPKLLSAGDAIVLDRSGSHYTARFDAYLGDPGRRQAVTRFLDQTLALPPGQRLLLHSGEDMAWLTGDDTFLRDWQNKLAQIVARGDQITIIHNVDRETDELAAVINQWLPLHLSGRICSHFYPHYRDSASKSTCFLLQDVAVVTGGTVAGSKLPRQTAYFTDPATLSHQQMLFEALLRECRPLLTACPTYPVDPRLLSRLEIACEKPYDTYLLSPVPVFATMSEATLLAVCQDNHLSPQAVQTARQVRQLLQSTLDTLRFPIRHVYDQSMLEQLVLGHTPMVDPYLSLYCGREVQVSRTQLLSHLTHLLELLNHSDRFEIGLATVPLGSPFRDNTIWIKQNELVVASPAHPRSPRCLALLAEESTVVSSFCHFFAGLWQAIPRVDRSKGGVASRLCRMVEALQSEQVTPD